LAVAVTVYLMCVSGEPAYDNEPAIDLTEPLPSELPSCRLQGEAARARAEELESLGEARWERVPFDIGDAPRAVLALVEAESCYELAGQRESVQRTASKRRQFEEELAQRWARARLLLERARREGDAKAVSRHTATQLALSAEVGPSGEPYRSWLRQLDHTARTYLTENASDEEK
jgi:hypothetical protein